jgi:S-formylglutathione hydrolase FrmB
MRRTPHLVIAVVCLVPSSVNLAWSQPAPQNYAGAVERIKVHGKLLEGNLGGDSPDRDVSVYLPASYDKDKARHYPVIYFLHGGLDYGWFHDPTHWLYLPPILNRAFGEAGNREMIVVMPSAGGSFYGRSVHTGDWEGFITQELTGYIDAHYRTLVQPGSRGLAGHSMGGYGAIRIGMKYPGTFSTIYAFSPCCMGDWDVRWDDAMKAAGAVTSLDQIRSAPRRPAQKFLAEAAAWSPAPNKPPLYFELPFKDGKLQPLIAAKWAANAPLAMLDQYIQEVRRLKAIAIDMGDKDELAGIKMFDLALNEYKIPHAFEIYPGDHTNHVGNRIEAKVVPFFSKNLAFQ